MLHFYVQHRVAASRVALITLVTPVLALVLGQAVNGETIGPRQPVGAVYILTGLACYQ